MAHLLPPNLFFFFFKLLADTGFARFSSIDSKYKKYGVQCKNVSL